MNDSSDASLPPYLTVDSADDLNDILKIGESGVILNHPAEEALSLGRAIRAALRGQTRSFTALAGFLGGRHGDDDLPDDDPVAIIRRELREGWQDKDDHPDDHVGFRLGFGGVNSKVPEIALRAWYWLCRWHHPEYGEPAEAEKWKKKVLSELKNEDPAQRDFAEVLFGDVIGTDKGPWSVEPSPNLSFGSILSEVDARDEEDLWEDFCNRIKDKKTKGLTEAAELLAYLLQRSADVRVQPHPKATRKLPDDYDIQKAFLHAKLYLIERGQPSEPPEEIDTVSFIGSSNWSRAALAKPDDEGQAFFQNIEISVAHRQVGQIWDIKQNAMDGLYREVLVDAGPSTRLATKLGQTGKIVFDQLVSLGKWIEPEEILDAESAYAVTNCEDSPLEHLDISVPDTDESTSEVPEEYARLLQSLQIVIDRLIDLDLDDQTAADYQRVLSNDPSEMGSEFIRRLAEQTGDEVAKKLTELNDGEAEEKLSEQNPLFGGLKPSHYQMDGALRLMGMLHPTPRSEDADSLRGAFLTDEPGLGKTLVSEMTTAFLIAEKLDARIPKPSAQSPGADSFSNIPLRVSVVVPARLRGEPGSEEQDATGWHAHVDRIRQAAKWCLAWRLVQQKQYNLDALPHYFSALEFRVLSHTSLSRSLHTSDFESEDFEPEDGPLPPEYYASSKQSDENLPTPPNSKPADDLYWLATSEVVVIDESHNFRNDSSRATRSLRYALSLPIPGDSKWQFKLPGPEKDVPSDSRAIPVRRVLCLSATPFNNRVDDIVTQIGHFDQYQDWDKPFKDNDQVEIFAESEDLKEAIQDWKTSRHKDLARELNSPASFSSRSPRDAFDDITRHIYHHLESGRSLRVSEDLREKREKDRRAVRSRYSDGGPEYEWADRGGDSSDTEYYTDIFAPAVKWAREQQKGNDYEMTSEERARIDALLSQMMVQRSRARVIKNVQTQQSRNKEREDVEQMFRRPTIPRYPLRLNNPKQRERGASFEAQVVEQLSELFTRTKSDEKDSDGDTKGLNLFSYEINVRREREAIIPKEETQTGANAVGFQLLNLIKRLQSSPYAFMRSVIRGPLRRGLLELSYFEAFVYESLEAGTDSLEWKDQPFFDGSAPTLSPSLQELLLKAKKGILTLRRSALSTLRQHAGGLDTYIEILSEGERETGARDMLGVFGGFHTGEKTEAGRFGDREFRADVDQLREAIIDLNNHLSDDSLPEHSWLVAYLRDLAQAAGEPENAESCDLWADVVTSIRWLEDTVVERKGFRGIIPELYDGLPEPLHGATFGSVRAQFLKWFDGNVTMGEFSGGVDWLKNRLETDGRFRSLLAWLLLQNAARLRLIETSQDHHPVPPDDALLQSFPAGPKTLLFTEYTDTQEYLVACITAFVAIFEAGAKLPAHDLELVKDKLEDIRSLLVGGNGQAGEINRVVQRLDVDEEKLRESGYRPPVDPESEWLESWLNDARSASITDDYDPLKEVARDMFDTTARVCSDLTERLQKHDKRSSDDIRTDIGDTPDVIDGRAEPSTAESKSTADESGDPVDAFSPWYQIEPSDGEDSELHAERLKRAAAHPVHTLISTEVLAEGVNLQECGFITHYDLPWNPTTLIQRNGRIDRRINSRFENREERDELAHMLKLDETERPPFVKPAQVYHSTVVPVEPDVKDTEAYTQKVRQTLFRKLNTIRALFGLSSWPVVIDREKAEEVLSGELEYETPGFRRREDLFNAQSRLQSKLNDIEVDDLDDDGPLTVVAETDQSFIDDLLSDISGVRSDREAQAPELDEQPTFEELRASWRNVLAVCVTTWTPYRLESIPIRSVAEWRHRIGEDTHPSRGIVQATCLVRDPECDGGFRLVTWTTWEEKTNRAEFSPVALGIDSELDEKTDLRLNGEFLMRGYYSSLSRPDISRDPRQKDRSTLEPQSPSAFAEDIISNATDFCLSMEPDSSELKSEEPGTSVLASKVVDPLSFDDIKASIDELIPEPLIDFLVGKTEATPESVRRALHSVIHRLDSVENKFDHSDFVSDETVASFPSSLPLKKSNQADQSRSGRFSNIWILPADLD